MLNEDRIKVMTKVAIFEENEGKEIFPLSRYYGSDFVSLQVVKSIVASTVGYILVVVLWALYKIQIIMNSIDDLDYVHIGFRLLQGYVGFVLFFAFIAGIIGHFRYKAGKKKLKEYNRQLDMILDIYEKEQQEMNSKEITGGETL